MNYFKQFFLLLTVLSLGNISMLSAQKAVKPAVIYLKNLPIERIGTDSDEDIISDLKADDFFVLEVDCSGFPATSPELEDAILAYYSTTCDILKTYETDDLDIDESNVFLVPEGYRIKTNIKVWNFKEHGAEGSVDFIMRSYNETIVPKYEAEYNLVTVTDPDNMRDRNGNPINYDLSMDIVYPSGNLTNKVPLVMHHASSSPRPIPISPCNDSERLTTAIYPLGFLTTGYAWSIIDHCYNPLARNEVWDYFDKNYTLDDFNGLASSTAFVRYVKSHLDDYNLNGKIGSMGLSKASYTALRLSNKENANGTEYFNFNNTPNNKTQPWLGENSTIDVAYIAAGNGSRRIPKYINSNSVPIVTSAGFYDQYNKWNEFPETIKYLQNIDVNYLGLWMEDVGHNYPSLGTDLATGKKRYPLVKRYFDNYLKSQAAKPLEVFYVFPRLNASEVDDKGNSRILTDDVRLPGVMSGVSAYAPITVRFLSKINLSKINQYVKVYTKNSNVEVLGTWTAKMNDTNFCFVPTANLVKDEEYKIVISQGLQNVDGQTLNAEFIRDFTVNYSNEEVDTKDLKILATDDTYSKHRLTTEPLGSKLNMRVRYSQYNEWAFDGYLKFSINTLKVAEITTAKLTLSTGTMLDKEPININLYKTTTNWQESTLISTNRPTYDETPTNQVLFKGDGSDAYVEFDITAALKEAITNDEEFISFALRNSSGNSENIYFNSKEVENEKLRPYLVIKETVLGLNSIENQKLDAYLDYKKKELIYKGIDSTDLEIFDITGKLIFSKNKLPQNSSVSLSFLNSGIYFAVFTKEKTRISLKIIL